MGARPLQGPVRQAPLRKQTAYALGVGVFKRMQLGRYGVAVCGGGRVRACVCARVCVRVRLSATPGDTCSTNHRCEDTCYAGPGESVHAETMFECPKAAFCVQGKGCQGDDSHLLTPNHLSSAVGRVPTASAEFQSLAV